MKSGNFTAAQNKAGNADAIDSISELVLMCEKDGFIPRYYVDTPQDKVDRVLQDMQTYTRRLVTEEVGLGDRIEQALQEIERDKEKEAMGGILDSTEQAMEEALFSNEADAIIKDEEFIEFKEREQELEEENEAIFQEMSGGA